MPTASCDTELSPQETLSLTGNNQFKSSDAELLASPVTLPCGRTIPNRFAKVAMYEHLAVLFGGPPNKYHFNLYSKWAKGGWGMIVTGNFQVSPTHLSLGRDVVIPRSMASPDLQAFRNLASIMKSSEKNSRPGSLAIVQLSHAGRQSFRFLGGRLGTFTRPVAPCARRLGDDTPEGLLAKIGYACMFETPRALEERELPNVIEEFVRSAKFVHEAGFDGIQLHAAHGYLLSQFLSPKLTDMREDQYRNGFLLTEQIIKRIRSELPSNFVLGVKLNAGDYTKGGMTEPEALRHVKSLSNLGVDFIEISGGDYENPVFGKLSSREAFFASFSRQVLKDLSSPNDKPRPLILLTGGLRTPSQLSHAIKERHADILGLGRPSVLCPDLPRQLSPALFRGHKGIEYPDALLAKPAWTPSLYGASLNTSWYTMAQRRLAQGKQINFQLGPGGATWGMWIWAGPNAEKLKIWWLVLGFALILAYLGVRMIQELML
ncbi:hypothetical protein M422DRAFT_24885 [Sphaerobolus stellatus SS14]|nr:hypothetical protein M422DRAFT_24885 [Sphaerobolus stellatus SS14]